MLVFFIKWRLPLTSNEFFLMIKQSLDKAGAVITRFKDNLPGRYWLEGFRERHKISLRLADNLKTSRALVGASTVNVSLFRTANVLHLIYILIP